MLFGMVASRSTQALRRGPGDRVDPAGGARRHQPEGQARPRAGDGLHQRRPEPGQEGRLELRHGRRPRDQPPGRRDGPGDRRRARAVPRRQERRRARAEGAVRPARDEELELGGRADRRQPLLERARHGPAGPARPPARPLAGAPAHRRGVPLPDDAPRLRGRQHRLRLPDVRQRGEELDVADEHGRHVLLAVRALAELSAPAVLRVARHQRRRARRARAALRHRPHVRVGDRRPEVHRLPRRRPGRRASATARGASAEGAPPSTSSPGTRRCGTRCARRCSRSTRSTRTTRPASVPPTGAATTRPPCASRGSRETGGTPAVAGGAPTQPEPASPARRRRRGEAVHEQAPADDHRAQAARDEDPADRGLARRQAAPGAAGAGGSPRSSTCAGAARASPSCASGCAGRGAAGRSARSRPASFVTCRRGGREDAPRAARAARRGARRARRRARRHRERADADGDRADQGRGGLAAVAVDRDQAGRPRLRRGGVLRRGHRAQLQRLGAERRGGVQDAHRRAPPGLAEAVRRHRRRGVVQRDRRLRRRVGLVQLARALHAPRLDVGRRHARSTSARPALQQFNSTRYGSINHPGDTFAADIYAQAAKALRTRKGAGSAGRARPEDR